MKEELDSGGVGSENKSLGFDAPILPEEESFSDSRPTRYETLEPLPQEKKRIQLPESIFMFLIVASTDFLDVIVWLIFSITVPTVFLSILGIALYLFNWIFGIFVSIVIQIWLIMRGGRGTWSFVKNVLSFLKRYLPFFIGSLFELVPMWDILPWQTIGLVISIYLINRPSIDRASRSVGPLIKAAEEVLKK